MKNRETNNSKKTLPLLPPGDVFSRFLTPNTAVPSPDKAEPGESTILQLCSSLRINLGGSPGPQVARRDQARGKEIIWPKFLRSKKTKQNPPNCGLRAEAEHSALLQPPGTARAWKNKLQEKGKTPGNCYGCASNTTGRSCCWPRKPSGRAGLSREGQSSEHSQEHGAGNAAPAPGIPKKKITK